jgi:hypothetical protein
LTPGSICYYIVKVDGSAEYIIIGIIVLLAGLYLSRRWIRVIKRATGKNSPSEERCEADCNCGSPYKGKSLEANLKSKKRRAE